MAHGTTEVTVIVAAPLIDVITELHSPIDSEEALDALVP